MTIYFLPPAFGIRCISSLARLVLWTERTARNDTVRAGVKHMPGSWYGALSAALGAIWLSGCLSPCLPVCLASTRRTANFLWRFSACPQKGSFVIGSTRWQARCWHGSRVEKKLRVRRSESCAIKDFVPRKVGQCHRQDGVSLLRIGRVCVFVS